MPEDSQLLDAKIIFFGCDPPLRAALQAHATAYVLDLKSVQAAAGLMFAAATLRPRVLILEADCLPPGRSIAAILERLGQVSGTSPRLICLVSHPQSAGASAAFGGATSPPAFATFQAPFDAAPFDAARICARVNEALARHSNRARRVLVVDAVPAESDEIVATLSAAGLLVERLSDPQRVMAALEQTPADLILLDLNLLQDASRSLTAAIRRHESHLAVPIIFLSGLVAAGHQGDVLRLGDDEYLARPVVSERLLTAVFERLALTAAGPRAAPDASGEGAPALRYTQLIKRLDHTIRDRSRPADAQAVLFIRVDEVPAFGPPDADAREALDATLIELVRQSASAAQHGVARYEDGVCSWARCQSDSQIGQRHRPRGPARSDRPPPDRHGQAGVGPDRPGAGRTA